MAGFVVVVCTIPRSQLLPSVYGALSLFSKILNKAEAEVASLTEVGEAWSASCLLLNRAIVSKLAGCLEF